MIEVFEQDIKDDGRKSSKGNQLKWCTSGYWYKADYLGYEGLAECVVSALLQKSNLTDDEFVIYEPEQIKYKSVIYSGCKSKDFSNGLRIITLERLFMNQLGKGLNRGIYSIKDHKERIAYMANQVERVTGLRNFGIYLNKLFTIDAVFLNEDRHTHNISVMVDGDGNFKLCPIYDNGAALLSDTRMDYPIGADVYESIESVKAKTVCDSFEEQLELSEKLYGSNIKFHFDNSDVTRILDSISIYNDDEKSRVFDIIAEQRRKYQYLFE